MNNLDKYRGMNPHDIELVSKKIHKLLRDHERFIGSVNSLSDFFSEYKLLVEYLKNNHIIFQKEHIDEEKFTEINKFESNPIIMKRKLEQISERFYLSMRDLEKLDEALSQSKNLFDKRFFLERNFHNS